MDGWMDGWMDGFKKIEFEETELQARIRKEAKDAEHDVIEGIGNKTQVGEKIHLADGSLSRFVVILNTASRVHFLRTQDPPGKPSVKKVRVYHWIKRVHTDLRVDLGPALQRRLPPSLFLLLHAD
jgi:hypothetical protein